MAYVSKDVRVALRESLKNVVTLEELDHVITTVIVTAWNQSPDYNTLHFLRKQFVTDPKNSKFITHLRSVFADRFTVADLYTAAAEAFYEFRDRVGKMYKAKQCLLNSDLEEYEKAIVPLMDEIMKIKKDQKTATPSLILPGGSK